jgi:hypothetical protein
MNIPIRLLSSISVKSVNIATFDENNLLENGI